MAQAETTLITPRRNFLIRALGFTAAGATMAIPIITAASAKERMDLHAAAFKKAFYEYHALNSPREYINMNVIEADKTSVFMLCAG